MKHKLYIENLGNTGFLLFVNVKVNGRRCRFLVDTGASRSVIDKTYFQKWFNKDSIKTFELPSVGFHGSTTESHHGTVDIFEIGETYTVNYTFALVDLSNFTLPLKQLGKRPFSGILGCDLLQKFDAVIDYKAQRLCTQ